MSITHAELKERQRAERDGHSEGLALRVHRALSWLDRAEQCEDVERFARRLKRRSSVKIIYVDEHLSSEQAKQRLGIPEQPSAELRKKGVIDAEAASILLQSYLDGTLAAISSE